MRPTLDLIALTALVDAGEVDTILVVFPDMQGRLMGKRTTGHYFLDHARGGMHACDYLLATDMEMQTVPGYHTASWELGYGDFTIVPELSTLRRIGWLDGTALVFGNIVDHTGAPHPCAPRSILETQRARLTDRGLSAQMASELEFYVFDETYADARRKGYRDLVATGDYIQDYNILQTTKDEPLLRAIRNHMDAAGVAVEGSKGEWGPGQEELNLVYAEALAMADRHSLFKHGAKEIAHQQGKAVTFMAKWRTELAGSSCHIHTSLWRGDTNVFTDSSDGDGHSGTFRHFLAGQLVLAREMTFFLAPTINAYKRFQAASFAPIKVVWCDDNRTAGFRVVGSGSSLRIECRIPGADVNPYLAYAALIAAGLYGIDNELELEPEYAGDAYAGTELREVPKTLREAVDLLDESDALRAALGDAVVDHYVHAGRWEQQEFDRRVTDWELFRNFERA